MNFLIFILVAFFTFCLIGFTYAVTRLIVMSIQSIDRKKFIKDLQNWGAAASYAINR